MIYITLTFESSINSEHLFFVVEQQFASGSYKEICSTLSDHVYGVVNEVMRELP
jgi:hypothetical protein